ncbi:MAG TPA: ABC transporter ATP-binding protein [Smithellaceae bacterium]|nr:ABC transporter ATP-binding protein [Smithellaceae bacterium]HRS83337.1 ABC transporter ATP-binding protein [Smithellaceae bacterium]
MLSIKDLNAAYGVIPVLHGVNMEIREGELVALLGANGAGKTTLLNNISGVLPAISGTISFQGKPIGHLSSDQIVHLGISQIPEGRKIFPYLSVKENLLMGASTKKAWKNRKQMMERVCALFPILKERSEQRASLMSGGEQQMLVIARGLMAQPKLLMIDEPSLGLSPLIMSQIYDVIKTFPENGITVLLSEQNALYALEIASRGYVLQDGHVVLEGSSEYLLNSELVKKAYIGM